MPRRSRARPITRGTQLRGTVIQDVQTIQGNAVERFYPAPPKVKDPVPAASKLHLRQGGKSAAPKRKAAGVVCPVCRRTFPRKEIDAHLRSMHARQVEAWSTAAGRQRLVGLHGDLAGRAFGFASATAVCPHCHEAVRLDRLDKHIERVHPEAQR